MVTQQKPRNVVPKTGAATAFTQLTAAHALPAQPRRERVPGEVKGVNDGDTIRCTDSRRVRLLQIDASEKDQRPMDPVARTALLRLAPPGAVVQLETDVRRQESVWPHPRLYQAGAGRRADGQ